MKWPMCWITPNISQTQRGVSGFPTAETGRREVEGRDVLRGRRPRYFAGYGHFDSVIKDLPNFSALGASLIQDGRAGPSSMNADGTLRDGAVAVLQGLDSAAKFGMREDFLLSPHYYPDWAGTPDLDNGNIGFLRFNLFHPKARDAVQKWAEVMAAGIKKQTGAAQRLPRQRARLYREWAGHVHQAGVRPRI